MDEMKANILGQFVLLIVALLPFSIERQVMGVWVTSADLLIAGALVLWIFYIALKEIVVETLQFPLILLISGLVLSFTLSIFTSINVNASIKETAKYVLLFAFFSLLVNQINTKRLLGILPHIISTTAFIVSVWFIVNSVTAETGGILLKDWRRYPFSTLHYNQIGSLLVISIPFGFYTVEKARSLRTRCLTAIVIMAQAVALIFTYSRISWLAALLVVVLIVVYRWRKIGLMYVLRIGVISCVAVMILRPNHGVVERLISLLNRSDTSLYERSVHLDTAFSLICQHLWTGVGLGNYREATVNRTGLLVQEIVHNIYLQVWAEAGLFAMVLLILLIVKYLFDLRSIMKSLDNNSEFKDLLVYTAIAFMAAVLANQLGDPFVRISKEYFMLLMALPYAIKRVYSKASKE